MDINIEFPSGVNYIDFLTAFSECYSDNPLLRSSFLGAFDSIRQAELIATEPLGLFACLTAEEEAACMLYYALLDKGYPVPKYGKLQQHGEKVKVLFFCLVLIEYFYLPLSQMGPVTLRVEAEGGKPKISFRLIMNNYVFVVPDPLSAVSVEGDGESGHHAAARAAVLSSIANFVPAGETIKKAVKDLQNRRNLAIYGDPKDKNVLHEGGMHHFKSNCIVMSVFAMLIMQSEEKTSSMLELVDIFYNEMRNSMDTPRMA